MSLKLSIVMPCLNEEETLEKCINDAKSFLSRTKINGEIIIADNGSTDNSINIANKNGAKVVNVEKKGYGAALRGGIEASNGKYIIFGDSDSSYDFSALDLFIEKLEEGYDLVMGNRFKGGIKKDAMPFLHKYLGNPVLSFIGRLFFNIKIGDFNCGLRGFRKETYFKMNPNTSGMEFALEIVVKAALYKMKITEVPTILYPDGRSRSPHLRTWHDGWRDLRFLLLFSPKWLFLYPGIIITLFSFLIMLLLVITPITFKSITFSVHTLLYTSIAFLIGIQLLFFSIFAKIYSIRKGLYPETKYIVKIMKNFTLEKGLILGTIFLILGVLTFLHNILTWSNFDFQELEPIYFMRQVIPSAISLILGVQIIVYSFIQSLLTFD